MTTSSHQSTSETHHNWVGLWVLGLCFLTLGWAGGFAWAHKSKISELWLQASEQKYLTMTGEIGPVTYLVTHDDFSQLENYAINLDDVLGVEVYEYPDKAAIAFNSATSASIDLINGYQSVISMRQQYIPMICH